MEQTSSPVQEWYAVHVRSRHEFKVQKNLNLKGIEAFLPTVERISKWKDRDKIVAFPLFPGYLFINIPKTSHAILTALKTKDIVKLLGSVPGKPAPIPDVQIAFLRKLIENKKDLDPYPYLKEGQLVRIKKGPLAGVEGILTEKLGKHMLVLSIDVLRQGVALKISASDVENI